MSVSPTNRYMNNSTVTWTASGVTTGGTTIAGIKSISQNDGLETLLESADADKFHTVGGVTLTSPTVTLHTIDAFAIYSVAGGTSGTLTWTVNDFTNGAVTGGGAKIGTLDQAFLAQRSRESPYRQLATQQITFDCVSTDGSTNPLGYAAA